MKDFKTKKITVNEVEYTLQSVPTRKLLELQQEWTGKNGQTNNIKMFELLLDNIVVEPKVKIDDLTAFELDELGQKAWDFAYMGK